MTFIQMVRFIHNEFEQICDGDRSKVDTNFWKQCCLEIGFPIKEDNEKGKNRRESHAFSVVYGYFRFSFRMGKIWNLIDDIFSLWENIGIKNKKVKKSKSNPWGTSKTSLDVKNLP